jgi:predicted Zn-dependent protease
MQRNARLALTCLASAALALACARNPVTGKRQLALVSEEQEIELGKQAAQQTIQSIPPYPDEKLQQYVSSVGMRIAKASERPNLPWSFTVLDDPTVNAFALPGGPIFITRGILAHLSSEAELAGVLGHEIGHITARHSVEQLSKAELAQLGVGIGSAVSPEVAQLGQLAGAGLQLLFLKFGRDAERQADSLGFRYMLGQRYDPREMAKLFRVLERQSALEGGGKLPAWASTHPDPGEREKTAEKRATEVANAGALEVGRDRYLPLVNGIVFGEDPRQGFFEGNTFVHPGLKFQLTLPAGWKAQNTPQALVAVSPKQDGAIQLTLAGKMSPEDAAKQFFGQQGIQAGTVEKGSVNGLTAVAGPFTANTEQGPLRGVASFVSHGGATFMVVGFAPAQAYDANAATFRQAVQSFGPLQDRSAENVQPAKVELVKVPRDMTLEQFAQAFPSSAPVEVVGIVNGVEKGGTLPAGATAKRIVGGPPGGLTAKGTPQQAGGTGTGGGR